MLPRSRDVRLAACDGIERCEFSFAALDQRELALGTGILSSIIGHPVPAGSLMHPIFSDRPEPGFGSAIVRGFSKRSNTMGVKSCTRWEHRFP
jgi:hypothetical protein